MNTVIIILLVVLAIAVVLLFAICGFLFNQVIWYKPIKLPAAKGEVEDDFAKDHRKAEEEFGKMPFEKLTLTASNGEKIYARLLLPEKSNGRMIIACHGAHSSGICEFCFSAPYFHRMGYTILMLRDTPAGMVATRRLDGDEGALLHLALLPEHRGCGESEGKFLGYGTHESKDTFLWIDCARKRFPELDIFLLGVSMGGATVLMMSDKITDPTVKGIIADCSYTSAWDEFAYQLKNPFGLPAFPLLYIFDLYCRIICKYSLRDASPIKAVRGARVPILFIHGAKDALVPVKMQKELFDACPTQKEMLTVENAVHAQSYYTDPRAYEATTEKFINECENTENTSALSAPGGGKQIGQQRKP